MNWFKPQKKHGLYIGISTYDKISIEVKGVVKPITGNPDFQYLKDVQKNVTDFSKCMEKYHIRQEDSVILHDPSPSEVDEKFGEFSKKLMANKRKSQTTLLVMFFTGLGIQIDGVQALLYN